MTQEGTQVTTPQIQYVGDGVQTNFSFSFQIFDESNLKVYLGSDLQQTGYTVQKEEESLGGTVIFNEAPTSGELITLTRELDLERTTDFASGGVLRAADLNYEFDYQMGCLQQLSSGLSRSLLLPVFENKEGIDFSLPAPEANKALVWNAQGNSLMNSQVEIGNLDASLSQAVSTVSDLAEEVSQMKENAQEAATTATTQAAIATQKATEVVQNVSNLYPFYMKTTSCDLDTLTTTGIYEVTASAHYPLDTGYYHVEVYVPSQGNIVQTAYAFGSSIGGYPATYRRRFINGAWEDWLQISNEGMGSPSGQVINISVESAGEQHVLNSPANGFYCLIGLSTAASQEVYLSNSANGMAVLSSATAPSKNLAIFLPVSANQNIRYLYTTAGTVTLKFIYAKGV